MEIESELRRAELIENAILPEDTVSPGTVARYRDLANGVEGEITILGPWDAEQAEHVVSYRAPLAAGLLGKKPGQKATITLPSGTQELQVIAVRPFVLDH
jgi:transcription elongation GreA/GreB family factor